MIDALRLWCWRRLLRVSWSARRWKQSWRKSTLNIHWKDYCWSWSFNTLAIWCKDLTLEKVLMLGKIEGKRRKGWQRMRWVDSTTSQWTWIWANSRKLWRMGEPGVSAQSHCRKGEFQTERARGFMEQFREPPSRELLPPRRHLKQGPARPEHRGWAGESRVAIFRDTFVSKQRALCQLF